MHRDRRLAAELGGVRVAEVGAAPARVVPSAEPYRAGRSAASRMPGSSSCSGSSSPRPSASAATPCIEHRVVVGRRVVVVAGVEVVARVELRDALLVRVAATPAPRTRSGRGRRRRPGSPSRRCRPRRSPPGRSCSGRTTNVSQTRIGTYWHFGQTPIEPSPSLPRSTASSARPDAVVLGREVARRVLRVVVVVEEVPAGDVVDVAVAVVVARRWRSRLDQVLRRSARGVVHARVVLVVVHVEHAVGVEVVAAQRGAVVDRLGLGQLVRVERAPCRAAPPLSQLMPVSRTATGHARVAAADLPGAGGVEARDLRLAERCGGLPGSRYARRGARPRGREAEQVEALVEDVRGRRRPAGRRARRGRSRDRRACRRAGRWRRARRGRSLELLARRRWTPGRRSPPPAPSRCRTTATSQRRSLSGPLSLPASAQNPTDASGWRQ